MAFSILIVSCSPEQHSVNQACSGESGLAGFAHSPNLPLYTERAFELAYTMYKREAPSTSEDFFALAAMSDIGQAQKETILELAQRYAENGFVPTLDLIQGLSLGVKNHLTAYSQELETFVIENEPSLEEFVQFQEAKLATLGASGLCAADVDLLTFVHASTIGVAKFLYKFQDSEDISRSCNNFWRKLLCGTLGAIVLTISVWVLVWITTLPWLVITVTDRQGNVTIVPEEDEAAFAALIGAALGVALGSGMYNWCCSWFDDNLPSCNLTTGSTLRELSWGTPMC